VAAGKTVTAEFAVPAPGPTRNPADPRYSPGGSSSGSAAAVLCDDWRPAGPGGGLPVPGVPTGPYLDRAGSEAREAFANHVRVLR
jgi:Amidase